MRAHHQDETHYFNAQACQHEGDPRGAGRKQSQRSQNQAPTGQQQQKTENLHEGRPPRATYLLLRRVSLASASKPIQPIFGAHPVSLRFVSRQGSVKPAALAGGNQLKLKWGLKPRSPRSEEKKNKRKANLPPPSAF